MRNDERIDRLLLRQEIRYQGAAFRGIHELGRTLAAERGERLIEPLGEPLGRVEVCSTARLLDHALSLADETRDPHDALALVLIQTLIGAHFAIHGGTVWMSNALLPSAP